jgi:hypothetical protein
MNKYTMVVTCAAAPLLWLASCNGQLLVDDEPGEGGAGAVYEGPLWEGNESTCPESVPASDSICAVSDGQVCLYDTPTSAGTRRSLCACWEEARNVTKWSCYSDMDAPYTCPSTQPEAGSSCFGLFGASCAYPERITCDCSSKSGAWSCTEDIENQPSAPPTSPDPTKPINTLSPEERASWCDWFASVTVGEGHPEPAPPPIDENGYAIARGCARAVGSPRCSAAIPVIPRSTCEANLALSTCEAPLSELSDCVQTLYDGCWPHPHGCHRYFEHPGCDGTIAISTAEPSGAGGTSGTSNTSAGSSSIAGMGGFGFTVPCNLRVQ